MVEKRGKSAAWTMKRSPTSTANTGVGASGPWRWRC